MKEKLEWIDDFRAKLPAGSRDGMRVSAVAYASRQLMEAAEDSAVEQLTNVACLQGVVEPVLGMPDMHWGYGLPMGAVGAFDAKEGIISAGCTGFDINCGIHMLRTDLTKDDIKPRLKELVDLLFRNVPCGVGSKAKVRLNSSELNDVLLNGARWAVEKGYGTEDDLKRMEENGMIKGADPSKVSPEALKRGAPQVGTLGAGNHFLEVQAVSDIYDAETAKVFGIGKKDQVTIMVHCGSRGFGHQVASDYLKIHHAASKKYGIKLPDPQLVCAPVDSKEGQDYFAAMKCAVNYAFANRQMIAHWIRLSFEEIFGKDWESLGMHTIYDVCHNICKLEEHTVGGKKRKLYVHRKGSTRAFAPGHKDVPEVYRKAGQPVLIAGSMGTASYVLKGTERAMEETFGSTCHGAGRCMSRNEAMRRFKGQEIKADLESRGEVIRATHPSVLAEESPDAYKDVDLVIESVHGAGISTKVARVVPLGVAKG
ncbi:MAG: RtcB family protein [archaeon]